MVESLAFNVEKFRREFWYLKGLIDTFVLGFAVAVVVFSITTAVAKPFNSDLEPFKIVSYLFSGSLLTVTHVLSTELAWGTRKAAARNEHVWYIRGTSILPVNTFDSMCIYSTSPNYVSRVLFGIVNSVYFIVLPIEQFHKGLWQWPEFVHWICFAPSILLAFALYALLIILVGDAECVFDIFFAVVSLQIFADLSNNLVGTVFSRTKSVGRLMEKYTEPSSGIPKLVTYTMGKLVDNRGVLDIDLQREPIYEICTFPELLSILVDCVKCYGRESTIRFAHLPQGLDTVDQFQVFLDHTAALIEIEGYSVNVELPQVDFQNVEDQYGIVRVAGEQV